MLAFNVSVANLTMASLYRTRTHSQISAYGTRSFEVTDFGTNRKLIYDFLLVINTNFPPILHRFRDIAVDRSEIAILGYPSCV